MFMDYLENVNDVAEGTGAIDSISEIVGETSVSGFEEIHGLDNKEIADYLNDVIPIDHLDSCPEIVYDPENEVFTGDSGCLGAFFLDSNKIVIASETRFDHYDELLDVLTHEVGHNEYANLERLDSAAAAKWEKLYTESIENNDGFGFVSDYAMTDHYEDFAESYATYIRDPELLKVMSPEKYAFMKYNVFDGHEYGLAGLNESVFTSMDRFMADVLKNASEAAGDDGSFDAENSIRASESVSADLKMYRCFSMIA